MGSPSLASKTVFLLDHTHWMGERSGIQIEIESGSGCGGGGGQSSPSKGSSSRPGGMSYFPSFIPPIKKTLWTCAVENVMEYSRIVWDLFANERLLRIGLCKGQGKSSQVVWLSDWEQGDGDGRQQQSLPFMSEKLAAAGPPMLFKQSTSSTVEVMQSAIKSAIIALAEPTPAQKALTKSLAGSNKALKPINKGRVICVTTCTADSVGKSSVDVLEDYFSSALTEHNNRASDHLLPILECEFILISIHPLGKENISRVLSRPLHEVSNIMRSELYAVAADKIYQKMSDLCAYHHELICTTVTGIPMKEEQNAHTSSNYDVPLWHPRMPTSCSESSILKWSSPLAPKTVGIGAGAGGLVHHCISACRITPVDVTSRPSTCLSSFVIGGRSVWLEMPKKGKSTSHMLTAHGGEMWMHIVETARNVLEDPPSISEGIGGRVTDYRIPDFAEFMKSNSLIPFPRNYQDYMPRTKPERDGDGSAFIRRRSNSLEESKKPVDMAKSRLVRKSQYWPMTISGSLLFPMTVHIESLLRLIPQDTLSETERVECDKCLWNLMSVEARGEAPLPSSHHKKGQKRDEQWKAVYSELENFIRANLHSETHKQVLDSLLIGRKGDDKISTNDDVTSRLKDSAIDNALAEMANITGSKPVITDSPMSPPPANPPKVTEPSSNGNKNNLLALWTLKTEKKDLRTLSVTKLYAHLGTGTAGDGDKKADTKS